MVNIYIKFKKFKNLISFIKANNIKNLVQTFKIEVFFY